MKTWRNPIVFLSLAFIALIFFYSCQKEQSNSGNIETLAGKMKLSVFLTDGPLDFQQVLVDIQRIEVKLDTCRKNDDDDHDGRGCDNDHDSLQSDCEIWDTLVIRAGVYDLLTLRNGVDTLLASGFILNGKIERIKVTLGTNNSVMVDSVIHPLLLSGNQNFVYFAAKQGVRVYLDAETNWFGDGLSCSCGSG